MPVVTQSGLRTNYQIVGPALTREVPPVALIHGLGANLAFWYLGAVRHLGRDRTFLLHDMRGHGASSMPRHGYKLEQLAEDFRQLLDELGIERAHVVGHSHGARVALVFALKYPHRVESLTLADTQLRALQKPMKLGEWPHWPEWKADLKKRGVSEFPPEDAEIDFRLLADLGPRSAGGAKRPAANSPARQRRRVGEKRRIDLGSRQMGTRGADQWQTLLETTDAKAELGDETAIDPNSLSDLTMPVLLMYGRLSHCLPTSEALERRLPDVRRMLVPGAGHFFPIVKPQFFARGLRMFLAGVDTRAGRPVPDVAAPIISRAAGDRREPLLRRRG